MELGKGAGGDECSVCVAVKIRPLVPAELEQGCRTCLTVTPGVPVVRSGHHQFTYDHVFGGDGSDPDLLYPKCVAPLVDGLFKGYNATVFAYGQTGSGKTFTMGSEYRPGGKACGVIPEAINAIFKCIEANKDYESSVRVSFVEIHKEEIRDLLVANPAQRSVISIRESTAGGVSLYGAAEMEVKSVEQMARILEAGTLARSTASTSMNSKSSRSHAIYTITVEQRRQVPTAPTAGGDDDEDADEDTAALAEDPLDDYLCAKLHLVDLAGSERAKRTKAEKDRLKEGIHINRGLLALGNVISALVDKKSHVPYRDSKLTRLLQDSLGGNSRTVMIACISPADINLEEGLNTLRYADRARHIRNKPTVNRDPVTAQVAALRQQVARLEAENAALKRSAAANGRDPLADVPEERSWQMVEELQGVVEQLQQDNRALELESAKLKVQLVQSHKMIQQLKGSLRNTHGGQPSSLNTPASQRPSTAGTPVPASAEPGQQEGAMDSDHMQEVPTTPSPAPMAESNLPDGEEEADNVDEQCFYAEMAAHSLEQEKMKQDMAVLQRMLEQKEKKMQDLMRNSGQVPALKQHYDRVLQELEKERDNLQNEKVAMMQKLQVLHAASEEERKRLEHYYKERIAQYDERLREVRRKEREFMTMQKLKLRTDEMCNRLNADIARIKQQKVALMKNMDASARQFAAWKANREKEVLQLRRQNRRNVVHIQHLEALQAKQNAVLQRKISDATAARKKLKELQAAGNRDAGRSVTGSSLTSLPANGAAGAVVEVQPNAQAPLLRNERSRKDWLEKELDMCNQSFEYQRVLDGELAQRAETSRQLREIEKRLMVLEHLVPPSPLVVDGSMPMSVDSKERLLQRKQVLQQQLADHNAQIIDLQAAWEQAKLEEEGKGGGAADAKRWTGVRNIIESRELLRSLFKVACDHKSQAKDVQMDLIKSQEELDLMRVQLDAARKEAEAQRKRAAAIEATAATAMTTPFAAESATQDDEMDAEVDDLLHQLQVVASTPNRQLNLSVSQNLNPSMDITRLHEAAGLDGTIHVQIQGPPVTNSQGKAADRYSSGLDVSLDAAAQEDGASVLIGSDSDMEMEEATASRKEPGDKAIEVSDDTEEDCDEGSDDDQDEDDAWDPSKATPATKHRRRNTLRRTSREPDPQVPADQLRRRSSSLLPLSSERAILEHVNQRLQHEGAGRVEKLTVKVLKDTLAGSVINGKAWRLGKKDKEQLLQDCCALLGLPAGSSDPPQAATGPSLARWGSDGSLHAISTQSTAQRASAVAAAVQQLSLHPHGSGQLQGMTQGASPSRRPPPSPRAPSPMALSPMAISPAPWNMSPSKPSPSQQGTPASPSVSWVVEQAGATLARSSSTAKLSRALSLGHSTHVSVLQMASPRQLALGGLGTPMPQVPDSPASQLSLGDPPREHSLTPLSMHFIQQAREARERTAQLRQSIQKGTAGYEAAAAARAACMQQDVSPSLSVASAAAQAQSSGKQSPRPSPRQSPSPRAALNPMASSTSPKIWR